MIFIRGGNNSWICHEHLEGNYLSCVYPFFSCPCSKQLSNPHFLASIKKKLDIMKEKEFYKNLKEEYPKAKISIFEGGYYVL